MSIKTTCSRCDYPMRTGEEMFAYHGYSSPGDTATSEPGEATLVLRFFGMRLLAWKTWQHYRYCLKCACDGEVKPKKKGRTEG